MITVAIYLYFLNTEYKACAGYIAAQAFLETGNFSSEEHRNRHNYFSMKSNTYYPATCRKPICKMKRFTSFKEAMDYQLNYYRRHNYSKNSERFLQDLVLKKYATDKKYIYKVKSTFKSLKRRNIL